MGLKYRMKLKIGKKQLLRTIILICICVMIFEQGDCFLGFIKNKRHS